MESKDSGFGVHRKIPERKFECFEVGRKLIYEGDEAEVIRKSPLLVIKAKNRIILIGLFAMCFIFTSSTYANKPTVTIEAPSSAAKGSEVTIKIYVEHNSDNFLHYVNWAYISVNGKEIARWDFSSSKRPEGNNFSREVKFTVTGPLEIAAEAYCNIHGSNGKVTHTLSIGK